MELLESKEWPEALPQEVVDAEGSDASHKANAEMFLREVVKKDVKNKKVLDYGCGAGHLVKLCRELGAEAVGFDSVFYENDFWKENPATMTTRWNKVMSYGPYDFVFMNDVFDHSINPAFDLYKIRTMLKEDGMAYIRFHPICSRHGGHIYKRINKAFAHMVLSDKEHTELGNILPIQRAIYPLYTYDAYMTRSGLMPIFNQPVYTPVEPFFEKNKILVERLNAFYGKHSNNEISSFQMSISYVYTHAVRRR
jgi:SAM-dependent methyltransferase